MASIKNTAIPAIASYIKKKKEKPAIPEVPALPNTPEETPKREGPQIFTQAGTGRPSGVEINGKTYLGINPEDVQRIVDAERRLTQIPEGATLIGANQPPQTQLIQRQPLSPDMTPAGIDLTELTKIAGGAATGAAGGAAAGTFIAPGAGTIVGGIIGGIAGGATTAFYSLGAERKQQVKTAYAAFTTSANQMDNIIKDVNALHYSKQQANIYWQDEYARILQSERELKELTKTSYGEKLARGLDELAKLEAWKRNYPELLRDFEVAKLNPDPTKINTNYANVATTEAVTEE